MQLDGRVVMITGGTGGLGQTVTPAFADAGATVVVVDRVPPPSAGPWKLALAADVTQEADVKRAVEETIQKCGRLDGLVNLVGGFALGRVAETPASLWQQMLTMNLTSAYLLSRAAAPHMVSRGSGRILHVAARAAFDPFPGAAAYIVSKAGLVGLIRVLAAELTGTGVAAHGVLPNTIDTPGNRKAMPEADPAKWVKPATIARVLLFLASDESAGLNGALIPIG